MPRQYRPNSLPSNRNKSQTNKRFQPTLLRWLRMAAATQAVGNGIIMKKRKRKLTSAEKVEKKRRQKEYMTIFINGKQKRVKRPPTIDGMDVDEFICRNADPIWLHQNEMWEYMTIDEESCNYGMELKSEEF
jgi:uncharacterized protein YnzC (UPF0291/DUF896 family)